MGQEEQATYTAKDGKLSAPDPETHGPFGHRAGRSQQRT
jgi:hypothetical protein